MPLGITHQGQFPSVTLSFNLAPGKALGEAITAIDRLESQIGMPASINAGFNGTAQAFGASLATEPLLIVAACLATTTAFAITPVSDAERSATRQHAIDERLDQGLELAAKSR